MTCPWQRDGSSRLPGVVGRLGFVSYETAGAFAWSTDIDRSFVRLVRGFTLALSQWSDTTTSPPRLRDHR